MKILVVGAPINASAVGKTQAEGERGDQAERQNRFCHRALRNFGTPMALAFAREGANLFLATLSDQAQLAHTARTVASLGVKVVTGLCDLSR